MKNLRLTARGLLLSGVLAVIMAYVFHGATAEAPGIPAMAPLQRSAVVLVIDPGHGGLDGGASAADGTTEKQVNLEIALRMEQTAKLFGYSTVLTRRTLDLDYPPEAVTVHDKKLWDQKQRVALIRGTENAVLFSIHQNKYPDPRPSGSQVLYAKSAGSRELGELTHANLAACLNPDNRRVAAPIPDTIYLMKEMTCPAILVECGFLSNAADTAKLKTDGYQKQLAVVLTGSFLQYIQSNA